MAEESDSEVLPCFLLLHKFCVSNATIYVSYLHCNLPYTLAPFHARLSCVSEEMNGRGLTLQLVLLGLHLWTQLMLSLVESCVRYARA